MKQYDICLFGVKETTKIIAEYLHGKGIQIDLIVSIDPSILSKYNVADYCCLRDTAQRIGADFYRVNDYSLKKIQDDFFAKNRFGMGISYGWQRLIPQSIMDVFQQGIYGFHASPDMLPGGRGRSPLNWGIILGKTRLYNHCFKYARDADAGEIYSIKPFSITPHDTIRTVLYKSLLTAREEIIRLIDDIRSRTLNLKQQKGEGWWFQKRTPEDGIIDFTRETTASIVNLVRAVTHPFPGAFCYTGDGKKLMIWEAWEFDSIIDFSAWQAGQVIEVLYHMPVVRTLDGSLIIWACEGSPLRPGDYLFPTPPSSPAD